MLQNDWNDAGLTSGLSLHCIFDFNIVAIVRPQKIRANEQQNYFSGLYIFINLVRERKPGHHSARSRLGVDDQVRGAVPAAKS